MTEINNLVTIGEKQIKVGYDFIAMMDCENTYQKITNQKMEFFDMIKPENYSSSVLLVMLTHGMATGLRMSGVAANVDLITVNNTINNYIKSLTKAGAKSTDDIRNSLKAIHNQIIMIAKHDLEMDFVNSPTV